MLLRVIFVTGASFLAAYAEVASAASPLSSYTHRARVLVVSAPSSNDADLQRQIALVHREKAGMRDRDLVVVQLVGRDGFDDRGAKLDGLATRSALSLPADRFMVLLIGKDGDMKMRSEQAISTRDLFGTIDAMPMRRNEMRQTGG